MSNPDARNALVEELQAKYFDREFESITKVETAYADDESMPDVLIAFSQDAMCIVNPFVTSCGRFSVHPFEAYGLDIWDAIRMVNYNFPKETSV